VTARERAEEAASKPASWRTEIAYKAEALGECAKEHETLVQGATVNAAAVRGKPMFLSGEICSTSTCALISPAADPQIGLYAAFRHPMQRLKQGDNTGALGVATH